MALGSPDKTSDSKEGEGSGLGGGGAPGALGGGGSSRSLAIVTARLAFKYEAREYKNTTKETKTPMNITNMIGDFNASGRGSLLSSSLIRDASQERNPCCKLNASK
ncbi:MAG: hypothetical protein DRN96_06280 [Thermoproteota archaeon]|nr:MAG: hypothetical protein DRN96_06280 [Candidatus Korarchaeota archaeon]